MDELVKYIIRKSIEHAENAKEEIDGKRVVYHLDQITDMLNQLLENAESDSKKKKRPDISAAV